jgi:hypothetical protein
MDVAEATNPANVSASVAGSWSGTIQHNAGMANTPVFSNHRDESDADRSTVSGVYTTPQFSGNVTGTTTSNTFSGNFSFSGTTVTGAVCTGTFAVTATRECDVELDEPRSDGELFGTPLAIVITAGK